jgi:hypothetical protein
MSERTVIWQPQEGPQTALIACPTFEVFYGGARGGGKTEASIGDWLEHSGTYGQHAVGCFFRRKFKQLEEVVARTKTLFPQIGAKYNEQKAEWAMPGGARLKFRYIERDSDAQEYQGHNYTRVYIEEATNFPTPAPIDLLRGTLRSAVGVPVGLRLTGNPGGPGHHWVKARYITPDPRGWQILTEEFKGVQGEVLILERVFIPSKISDNALLWKNDPFYVARLRQAGSEALVRAWLEGNWDLVDGAFFDNWDEEKLVLPARDWLHRIPPHTFRFRSFDWGYGKPFVVGWYAVSDGTWGLPDGALLKYREWYGSNGKPNVGIRMNPDLVAQGIRAREMHPLRPEMAEIMAGAVADPSIFIRDGGPSIAETMDANGVSWRKADNKRVPGWAEMRRRLSGVAGKPLLYFLDVCEDSIRTIPTLQVDSNDPEDLDTEAEDHAADETRYACMSRPWIDRKPEDEPLIFPKTPSQLTINELIDRQKSKRLLAVADAE